LIGNLIVVAFDVDGTKHHVYIGTMRMGIT
jgi:hypothetical protein